MTYTVTPRPTPYSAEYVDGAQCVMGHHLLPRPFARSDLAAHQVAEFLAPVQGHRMAKAGVEMAVLDADSGPRTSSGDGFNVNGCLTLADCVAW